MPGQIVVGDDPDDLPIRRGEGRFAQPEPGDPRAVLGREPGLDAWLGVRWLQPCPTADQSDVEIVERIAEGEHDTGISPEIPNLDGVRLGMDHDGLTVPPEPDRYEMGRPIGADRGQPDHRFPVEEPSDPLGGEAGIAVHGDIVRLASGGRTGPRSHRHAGHPSMPAAASGQGARRSVRSWDDDARR